MDWREIVRLHRAHRTGLPGPIKGKVIRISHMGYVDAFHTLAVIGALELALNELGHPVELGRGLAAAQAVFAERL